MQTILGVGFVFLCVAVIIGAIYLYVRYYFFGDYLKQANKKHIKFIKAETDTPFEKGKINLSLTGKKSTQNPLSYWYIDDNESKFPLLAKTHTIKANSHLNFHQNLD